MERVDEILKDIKINLAQRSASRKDEIRVMQGMLNDKNYSVGEYAADGKVGDYYPRKDAEKLVSSILTNGAHISSAEAATIASNYEFSKSDAVAMIGVSKEFINTYVKSGRKLPLGGREDMSVALSLKDIPAQKKRLPVNALNSKDKTIVIPKHSTIKAQGGCPKWVRD